MYRAVIAFADLKDGKHLYNAGDTFPREGLTVDAARLAELAGSDNRMRRPLIVEVPEASEATERTKRTRKRVTAND